MSATLLKNGRIIDPANRRDEIGDLLLIDGRIADPKTALPSDVETIDAKGFVVAPGLDAKAITQALRAHLDPVFLPRPLWLLDSLPRNATSKLPKSALQALYLDLSKH